MARACPIYAQDFTYYAILLFLIFINPEKMPIIPNKLPIIQMEKVIEFMCSGDIPGVYVSVTIVT